MQVFNTQLNYQNPSIEGYYGEFGGAYIPEMLFKNVETLKAEYLKIMEDPTFIAEVDAGLALVLALYDEIRLELRTFTDLI